jgi:hypothetical protein
MNDYLHIKIKGENNLNDIIDINNRLNNLKEIIKNNSNLNVIFNYNSNVDKELFSGRDVVMEENRMNLIEDLYVDKEISAGTDVEIEENRMNLTENLYVDRELFSSIFISENKNNLTGNVYFFLKNNSTTCNVCYENITLYNFKKIICNHCICNLCYEKWDNACLKKNNDLTCPMCRIKI